MMSWAHSEKLGGFTERHLPLSVPIPTKTSGPWEQLKYSFSIDAILSRDHRVAAMQCVYPQYAQLPSSSACTSSKIPYQQQLHQLHLSPFHHRLHHHSYEGDLYDVDKTCHPNRLIFSGFLHKTCRRYRTIFTTEQLNKLEEVFSKQRYMTGTEKVLLASTLRLSETQVKVWFQNRRTKWRKSKGQARNSLCSVEEEMISEDHTYSP